MKKTRRDREARVRHGIGADEIDDVAYPVQHKKGDERERNQQ